MGKVCVVCRRPYLKQSTASFHNFPTDENKRLMWYNTLNMDLEHCKRKWLFLCSDHFDEDSFYVSPNGKRYLKPNALPIISSADTERGSASAVESNMEGQASVLKRKRNEYMDSNEDLIESISLEQGIETQRSSDKSDTISESTESSRTLSATPELEGLSVVGETCETSAVSTVSIKPSEGNMSNNSDTILGKNESSVILTGSSNTLTASSETSPCCTVQRGLISEKMETPGKVSGIIQCRRRKQQRFTMSKHFSNSSEHNIWKSLLFLKKKVKNLQQQNRRLKAKVCLQKSLIEYLKVNYGLSPHAGLVLNAKQIT